VEHYALPAEVFGAGLIFARVGAMLMLLPGVGETSVPPRIRLGVALAVSFVLYPMLRARLPAEPQGLDVLFGDVVIEILLGLALGGVIRLFLMCVDVTGEVIAIQTTLAFSQTANPTEAQPGSTVATFLSIVALALVFSTNLHQMFIAAIVRSFTLFAPGHPPPVGDVVQLAVRTTGDTFALAIQLAAPILVFSLVFNVAAGLIGRILPSFQIFFAAAPLALLLGLSIFGLSIGMMGLIWIDRFRAFTDRLT